MFTSPRRVFVKYQPLLAPASREALYWSVRLPMASQIEPVSMMGSFAYQKLTAPEVPMEPLTVPSTSFES